MVKLLVADNDALAGSDLAKLYDTRTLDSVQAVCAANIEKVLVNILSDKVHVVVPDDGNRWNDQMFTIAGILEKLGRKPVLITDYLNIMNANPSALAGQPRLPVAGGIATTV